MTRIALIHVHSFYNAGDAALTYAAIQNLQDNFPDSQISVLMNDPASFEGPQTVLTSFLPWVQQAGKSQALRFAWLMLNGLIAALSQRLFGRPWHLPGSRAFRPALDALMAADLVVSTPGGYLYHYGRGRALYILLATYLIVLWAKKPLYLLPQSYGPFQTRLERLLVGYTFRRARLVMAREALSVQQAEACGVPAGQCVLLPDMAFAFPAAPPQAAQAMLQQWGIEANSACLGVTVINWGQQFQGFERQENYERTVAQGLRHFLDRHADRHPDWHIILFPQCWGPSEREDDRIPARRVAQQLPELSERLTVVETPLAPALLSAAFGQMRLFVGTRMHSNIFALSQHVPVFAIGYLHKSRGIAELVGISEWVGDINTITPEQFSARLDALCEQQDAIRMHLQRVMPALKAQARQAGQLIAQDYQQIIQRDKS